MSSKCLTSMQSDLSEELDKFPVLTLQQLMQLAELQTKIRHQEMLNSLCEEKQDERTTQKGQAERKKIFVSRLPFGHDKNSILRELGKLFRPFGKIQSLKVKHQKGSPPYGVVKYQASQSCQTAFQMVKGTLMFGKRLFFSFTHPQQNKKSQKKDNRSISRTQQKERKQKNITSIDKIEGIKIEEQAMHKNGKQNLKIDKIQGIVLSKIDPGLKKEQSQDKEETEVKRSSKEKACILSMIKEKRPNKPIFRSQRKALKNLS